MEIGMVRSIKENYRWGTGMVCGIPNGYNQGSHWVWGGAVLSASESNGCGEGENSANDRVDKHWMAD